MALEKRAGAAAVAVLRREDDPDPQVIHDREACANVMLDQLPKSIADAIREASLVHNRYPLWVTVAGLVLKAYENGEHQAPILDPSWPRQFNLVELEMKPSKCEWCGIEFQPIRWKQRFHSQECGAMANEALRG